MRMIGPLPAMGRRAAERGYNWEDMHRTWQEADMTGLLITAHLMTPYAPAMAGADIHIDSLLTWAVMQSLPAPVFFPSHSAAVMPCPLKLLWVDGAGHPLWASTPLLPVGEAIMAREYWHKRYPSDRAELANKRAANTSAGRWKEARVPLGLVTTSKLHGLCIGVESEVHRLIQTVTHVGKKPSTGYGRVAKWDVTPVGGLEIRQVLCGHPVPVDSPIAEEITGKYRPSTGWTPPYWYAPWHCSCITPEASM
jgi:hypothetical protein